MTENLNFGNNNTIPDEVKTEITADEKKNIKTIKYLVKETWELYKIKFSKLAVIIFIPALLYLFHSLITQSNLNAGLFRSIVEAVFLFFYLYSWTVSIPASIYILNGENHILEAIKRGIIVSPNYAVLYIIYSLIILGGFILLIIPSLIFLTWFTFSFFVLILENKKGPNALIRSKELVSGNFWGIVLRYFVLFLILIVPLLLLTTLLITIPTFQYSELPTTISGMIFLIIFSPFIFCFEYLLYKNIFEIKSNIIIKKSGKLLKFAAIFSGLIAIPVMAAYLYLQVMYIFSYDEKPYDDSNFLPSSVIYSEEENAFSDFQKISENLYYPDENDEKIKKMAEGKEWDENFAKDLIERNDKALLFMYESLSKKGYQDPALQVSMDNYSANMILKSTSDFRKMAQISAIRAQIFFNSGNQEKAFNEALNIMKFGQLLNQGDRAYLIQYLVGISVKNTALNLMAMFVLNTIISSEQLITYKNELQQFESRKGVEEAYKMEYVWMKNEINKLARIMKESANENDYGLFGGENETYAMKELIKDQPRYYFKPNQTNKLLAQHWQNHINSMDPGCNNHYSVEKDKEMYFPRVIFTENAIGLFMKNLVAISLNSVIDKRCEHEFKILQVQVMISTKTYKNDHGNFPTSIDKLSPKYIQTVPEYFLNRKVLYNSNKGKVILESDRSECNGSNPNPIYCEV